MSCRMSRKMTSRMSSKAERAKVVRVGVMQSDGMTTTIEGKARRLKNYPYWHRAHVYNLYIVIMAQTVFPVTE